MSKVVQISVLAKISGNVNADEVVGTRVTLKKMYNSRGEVLPFVSARAIKFAIRKALKERGFEVDPFKVNKEAREELRLRDTARPDKYIDNDLFGYMATIKGEMALKRQAPIAISYLKALKDTPIKTEFGARFSRPWGEKENPAPFEVEVCEFIGKVNSIIYDYVGIFDQDRKIAKGIGGAEAKKFLEEVPEKLDNEERKKRLRAFLEIFLTPSYVLPRATNSLHIPEYIATLVTFSDKGPLPIFQYLNYDFEKNSVDAEALEKIVKREEIKNNANAIMLIDYFDKIEEIPEGMEKKNVKEVVNEATKFLIG